MAITATIKAEYQIPQQNPDYNRGILKKRIYAFTKLATDSSVTIATGITGNKIDGVIVSGNVVDKPMSRSINQTTGVITLEDNGTAACTEGTVEVTYREM